MKANLAIPDQSAPAEDSMTILVCAPSYTASKKFVDDGKGGIQKVDYNAGMYFGVMEKPISDIQTLSKWLLALEGMPNAFVIRGKLIDPPAPDTGIQRLKLNFATPAGGRRWALIDFDKIPLPEGLYLAKDTPAVIEHLVSLLPAEFHDCSYHYQLSSSAGMGGSDKVSAHVWFWLTDPWPDDKLNSWAKAIKEKVGYKLVDPALFNDVQAHYTAAPVFDGVDNPFPVRSALVEKAKDAVSIKQIDVPVSVSSLSNNSGPIESGPGFDGWLARIGDHPGGEGFHEPIIKAIASYVSTHGREGTNKEVLFETIRRRVLAADRSRHDDDYVENTMASREHIIQAIDGALKKYGDQPSSRRRSRVVDKGVVAPAVRPVVSAEDARKNLSSLLDTIIGASTK